MRPLLLTSLALALLALFVPLTARAATTPANFAAIRHMVAAYDGVQAVRVVEHFHNGAVATVDVLPSGQYRIAETGGQDPSLIVKVATQPADGAEGTGTDNINAIGSKTIEGVPVHGYTIVSPDGTYSETLWVNQQDLPISARVQTQGHTIDVLYGDYNSAPLIAAQ